jgi:hypothetical protein
MPTHILTTTVEEIYARGIHPDTDIRNRAFYRAVIEELVARGLISVETDGIDVSVSVDPWDEQ